MLNLTEQAAKLKINNIYRDYLILSYYKSGLLRNTNLNDENLVKLEGIKQRIILETGESIQKVREITEKNIEIKDYIDPLKSCADLINSEYFYQLNEVISKVLEIYELYLKNIRDDFQISPLDQMKLTKIDFI